MTPPANVRMEDH